MKLLVTELPESAKACIYYCNGHCVINNNLCDFAEKAPSGCAGLAVLTAGAGGKTSSENHPMDLNNAMMELGIRPNLQGFKYIKTAIELCLQDGHRLDAMVKVLYPEIAEKYGSTPLKVERGIRHAIEAAFNENLCPDTIEKWFGNCIGRNIGKPTNSTFIATVVEHLKVTDT